MAIIGIDIGTQSLKVAVTSDQLAVLGEASRAYPVACLQPGWAEQDPRAWEAALAPAVGEALVRARASAQEVRAIGVCGQLDGCVGVDASGAPVTPCLIWMDRRATADIPASMQGQGAAGFRHTTGLVADAGHMAAKIAWLERNRPGAVRYHQPVSYLVERLTGAFVYDHGLASTTMLYHLARREHDPALLASFGIAADKLPAIAEAGALAGALTAEAAGTLGLRAGTPVAVGTGDDFATPLGAGMIEPGAVACVLGTAEVVGALSRAPVRDHGGLVETHGYANQYYFIENPGWLAGGAMTWLGDVVGVRDPAALEAAAAQVPPGADELLFLPALSGAMAPEWIADARGCFYGLTPAHGRGHLVRAVMEGCAFAMRDVIERLHALGVPAQSLLMLGGGARSRLWGQIRADLTGLPVHQPARVDTCPVGAAMLAAVAAGVVPALDQAAALVTGERRVIEPDPARRSLYDTAHARYRLLFEALRPLYRRE